MGCVESCISRTAHEDHTAFVDHQHSEQAAVPPSAPAAAGTDVQALALAQAATKQQLRVSAAAEVPLSSRETHPRSSSGYDWRTMGGPLMEEWLSSVGIVDAQWYVDLAEAGGTLPRWQEVPTEAFITPESAWRLRFCYRPRHTVLPVLVLS